jgi:class 3 adenylate cyclase
VYAAFASPRDAVAAALRAQVDLYRASWGEVGPLRVRMGLHTGEVERQGDHYFGAALDRCARLTAAAHGGQVLLSSATAEVREALPAAAGLRDLGEHRLKDLQRPERLFQLVAPVWPRTSRPSARSRASPTISQSSPRPSSVAYVRSQRAVVSSSTRTRGCSRSPDLVESERPA